LVDRGGWRIEIKFFNSTYKYILLSKTSAMSTAVELPYGLRRRHQAGPLLQRDGGDNDDDNNNNNTDTGGRVEGDEDEDVNISNNTVNEDGVDTVSQQPHNNNHNNTSSARSQTKGIGVFQISRVYILVSVVLALLAIILAPISTPKIEYHWMTTMMNRAAESNRRGRIPRISSMTTKVQNVDVDTTIRDAYAYTGIVTKSFEEMITRAALMGIAASKRNRGMETKLGDDDSGEKDSSEDGNREEALQQERQRRRQHLSLFKKYDDNQENKERTEGMLTQRKLWWSKLLKNNEATNDRSRRGGNGDTPPDKHKDKQSKNDIEWQWIDPVLLEHHSFHHILTNIIDKILKSTIRLCVITNYMVAMIYLLHSVVAAWFLLHSRSSNNAEQQQQQGQHQGDHPAALVTDWAFASSSAATSARERMVGFLVFKLLLISAVIEPDTLALMILVTWFTLLGCLRNLDHQAHSTNTHLTAMGHPPKTGVVQLLFLVLACDIVAACTCYTLLYTAGWDIVLLLTCDCALLCCDTIGHILKYYQCVLEDSHDSTIAELETRQLDLHGAIRDNNNADDIADGHQEDSEDNVVELPVEVPVPVPREGERQTPAIPTMTSAEIRLELRQLDRRMEGFELKQNRCLSILDSLIFYQEMTCHMLTVAHFCHTWWLHGLQFTLIDGIVAIHIHSAISAACTKVARRRNIHTISRNLNGLFPDATDEELKKASISGDVCCICLGTMSTGGNVKKIACGHLFHTHCLREVIEREQNLPAAKCPLCRAPLADSPNSAATGSPTNTIHNNNNINTATPERNIPVAPLIAVVQQTNHTAEAETEAVIRDAIPIRQAGRERALFRFSTEGILPIWLPFPAFSFEVNRRPALGAQVAAAPIQHDQTVGPIQSAEHAPTIPIDQELNPELENDNQIHQQQEEQQETQISFIRRLLMLAGSIPMSPEEEARALTQLVDMFPQYDRSDLSRELRNRGSLEAVTEAILMGIFSGVPRGE
ncbi:MAG: hypothetical protein ACI90V_009212, partial [Bacillariaceae sp.]